MNKAHALSIGLVLIFLGGCSTRGVKVYSGNSNDYSSSTEKESYSHPTMRPYEVYGIKYYPAVVNVGDKFDGIASWYGPDFHGKLTSNGETYNMHDMTAAHKTLPMNTIVKVTNEENGLVIIVRVNDRGPFVDDRIIDLSNAAAHKVKMVDKGTAPVSIEILGFEKKGVTTISKKEDLQSKPQEMQTADYSIQIGSFSSFDGALKTQEEHDGLDGYKTVIKDIDAGDSSIFKVWLSGFKSEKEVREYKATSIFKNSFIVRDN